MRRLAAEAIRLLKLIARLLAEEDPTIRRRIAEEAENG